MVETNLIFFGVALILLLPYYTKFIGSILFFCLALASWFIGFIIAYRFELELWMAVYLAGMLLTTFSLGGYWAIMRIVKNGLQRMMDTERGKK